MVFYAAFNSISVISRQLENIEGKGENAGY